MGKKVNGAFSNKNVRATVNKWINVVRSDVSVIPFNERKK